MSDSNYHKYGLFVLGMTFMPFLAPIFLIFLFFEMIAFSIVLNGLVLLLGGMALTPLLWVASLAGTMVVSFIRLILFAVTGGRVKPAPLPQTICSVILIAILSGVVFFYLPVHPIATKAEDVAYIKVVDFNGEHIIDRKDNVEKYMEKLDSLRMHRTFRDITDEDVLDEKSYGGIMTLYGKGDRELESFRMLDNVYFTVQRQNTEESFKAYTIFGELYDYRQFRTVYEKNEEQNELSDTYKQFADAYKDFGDSLSAEGTAIHFRIPEIPDEADINVTITIRYYKEPEEGKANNQVTENLQWNVEWVEGKDYYYDLAGKEYYDVKLHFYCNGAGNDYPCMSYLPIELWRDKKKFPK